MHQAERFPHRVALWYLAFGVAWILVTDPLVARLSPPGRPALATLKGIAFVLASALLIFWLVRREQRRLARATDLLAGTERVLAKVFESLDDAVLLLELPSREIVYCNPACERLLGYSRHQFIGRTTEFLHTSPEAYERFGREGRTVLERDPKAVFRTTFQVRRESGETLATEHAVTLVDPVAHGDTEPRLAVSVIRDVSALREREADLRESRERLRRLSHRLLESRERQAREISAELHDQLGALLTALDLNLSTLARGPGPTERIEESRELVRQASERVRNLLGALRPPLLDHAGLTAALRALLETQAERAGWSVTFRGDAVPESLPRRVEWITYRVAQEALTNVARHADADSVILELRAEDGHLHLTVQDDGAGFDPVEALRRAARGGCFGLTGMEERMELAGGTLEIRSAPGEGARVEARVPLSEAGTPEAEPLAAAARPDPRRRAGERGG